MKRHCVVFTLQNDPRVQIIDEVLASEREFELKLERWLAHRQKK